MSSKDVLTNVPHTAVKGSRNVRRFFSESLAMRNAGMPENTRIRNAASNRTKESITRGRNEGAEQAGGTTQASKELVEGP